MSAITTSERLLNVDSTNKLERMFEAQRLLQVEAYGKDPGEITDPIERIQFIKDMHIALTDELHEALAETGWKPWATSQHVNEEAFKGELIDAWHFFMNLCMVVGMGPDELQDRYMAKRQKNIQRQIDGYDGVSTKCPGCGRALDDDAVKCSLTPNKVAAWCVVKRDFISTVKKAV